VPGVIAAATGSDWNAGGSIMTFFFPVGLFVVVATILYMLFSRPHRRVPGHRGLASTHAAGTTRAAPRPGPSASVAGSPAITPSAAAAGVGRAGNMSAETPAPSGQDLPGSGRGDASSPPRGTTEGTEAGE
jgi:hypothetical protein